ncbi:PEP-CTERM sorting domain-containing protein [Congregibacter sp.]|uniref:PEP-CTERM sorting domain-containing protein n=1 Tax=Congregibacter sp. TaxID=2744308 RepID=UPI003F6D950B
MKYRAAMVLLLLSSSVAQAAAQEKTLLFIGNSFTFAYGSAAWFWGAARVTDLNGQNVGGVPALFEAFTEQAGLAWDVSLETHPGADFAFHLREKQVEITSQPWDVVVAHSYSTLDAEAPGDSRNLLRTGEELAGLLQRTNPDVIFYVTATWSRPDLTYRPGSHWSGKPIEQMALDVSEGYEQLAREVPGVAAVNPVGKAFNRAIRTGVADGNPYDGIDVNKIDLWTWDHYHGSSYGYYLEALVVFGNVTGVDPLALGDGECAAFELGLSRAQAVALQQVAHDELAAAGVALRTPKAMTPLPWATPCG